MRAKARHGPVRRLATLLPLLALLAGCTSHSPATARPSATTTPTILTAAATATPDDPALPPAQPASNPTVSPTVERARATFGTIVIAVTYVPTPTPYPPPLLATATATGGNAPTSIAAAEAEGAIYPRLDPPPKAPDAFMGAMGAAERKCVSVEGSGDRGIRSGGFAAGSFNHFYDSWRDYGAAKVWWVPEHSLRGIEIVVRAVRLDAPTDTVRQQIRGANADFFPSLVALPRGGTWLLIATGGPNWGCFVLMLPE